MDRMPHIWCPGCGIGTTVNCFARALVESKADLDRVAVVSGIGCTGRVAGYVKLDSFHTTHGRAIPFATGLKLANPSLQVVVYSGDGDLFAIGGNHLIHAARRNLDIKVICVNNLIYAMTGGQTAPTTPGTGHHCDCALWRLRAELQPGATGGIGRRRLCGALDHLPRRQLTRSMTEVLNRKGFCFIEVLSPCPTLYQRRNKMGDGLDTMKFYKEHSKIVQRRSHQRSRAHQAGRHPGGQIRGPRPSGLPGTDARPTGRDPGRPLRPGGAADMRLTEIRIAGFGGQGVILAAAIIGKASCIFQNNFATMTQSFGPEARGGSSSAQVILSDEPVTYPYITQPDILVVMSQEAFTRFSPELKEAAC